MSDQTHYLAWRETRPVPSPIMLGLGTPVVNFYQGQLVAIHAVDLDAAGPAEVAVCGMTVYGRVNGLFSQTEDAGRCGECAAFIGRAF
jgi:hypothetical protein